MKTKMKKDAFRKILVLIAFCFTLSVATAQIQTKFFGCVLGQTTKATALANLKARNIECSVQPNGCIYFYSCYFGGYTWNPGGIMSFHEGKFYDICFLKTESLEDNYNVDTNPRSLTFSTI